MEVIKGLVRQRLECLEDRKTAVKNGFEGSDKSNAMLKAMSRGWREALEWQMVNRSILERQKMLLNAYQSEVDQLTREYQALLQMKIEVGMIPKTKSGDKAKGRL